MCQEDAAEEKVPMVLGICESYNDSLPRQIVPIGVIVAQL